jgi:hypothetical protein
MFRRLSTILFVVIMLVACGGQNVETVSTQPVVTTTTVDVDAGRISQLEADLAAALAANETLQATLTERATELTEVKARLIEATASEEALRLAFDPEIQAAKAAEEAAQAAADEAALTAHLTEPRGDGIYTVGEEISPGVWRSNGSGDGCYWERRDINQEIIDNHYGNAGGSVNVRASDFEVEFDGCGTWEFQG